MLTSFSHSACPKSSCSQLTLFVIVLTENRKQKGEDSTGQERPKAKEARKERKVLEKKMALNRKRKLDSRLVIQQLLQHKNPIISNFPQRKLINWSVNGLFAQS